MDESKYTPSDDEHWAAYCRDEGLFGLRGLIRDCHFEEYGWRDWLGFAASVAFGFATVWAFGILAGLGA